MDELSKFGLIIKLDSSRALPDLPLIRGVVSPPGEYQAQVATLNTRTESEI